MFEFLDVSELFIQTLSNIGEFLLLSPLGFFGNFLEPFEDVLKGNSPLLDFLISINNISIASIIFGGSLLGILIFKLIKFFVDIVT